MLRIIKYQGEDKHEYKTEASTEEQFCWCGRYYHDSKICSFCTVNIIDKDIFSIRHCSIVLPSHFLIRKGFFLILWRKKERMPRNWSRARKIQKEEKTPHVFNSWMDWINRKNRKKKLSVIIKVFISHFFSSKLHIRCCALVKAHPLVKANPILHQVLETKLLKGNWVKINNLRCPEVQSKWSYSLYWTVWTYNFHLLLPFSACWYPTTSQYLSYLLMFYHQSIEKGSSCSPIRACSFFSFQDF